MIGSHREKGGTSASGEQSWRALAGPRRRRINSPQARKRRRIRMAKLGGGMALLILFMVGMVWGIVTLVRRDAPLPLQPPSKPIEQILFQTNGVLPDRWIGSVLQLKPGVTMMEVDIHSLKGKLESEGQVESASVERVFPNALRIDVKERVATMRLALMDADGKRRQRLVAQDGTVYDGVGYLRATLQHLPFVQPHQHYDGSFFPMRGIERVAELLELAKQEAPEIFSTWKVVSLEHYSGDLELPGEVIELRSALIPRVIFSASADFGRQMDRLVFILKELEAMGQPSVERIDLSLPDSAAVQLSRGPARSF